MFSSGGIHINQSSWDNFTKKKTNQSKTILRRKCLLSWQLRRIRKRLHQIKMKNFQMLQLNYKLTILLKKDLLAAKENNQKNRVEITTLCLWLIQIHKAWATLWIRNNKAFCHLWKQALINKQETWAASRLFKFSRKITLRKRSPKLI